MTEPAQGVTDVVIRLNTLALGLGVPRAWTSGISMIIKIRVPLIYSKLVVGVGKGVFPLSL